MTTQNLYRLGGIAMMVTALIFVAAAVAVIVAPSGGLSSPLAPVLYYLGLVTAAFAYSGVYFPQAGASGKLGLVGFILAVLGSVIYSGPNLALVASTFGVQEWHSIWAFSMGNALSLGGSFFLLGTLLLGLATVRAGIFPRWAGITLAAGGLFWFVAFWGSMVASPVITYLLVSGSALVGVGMGWIGWRIVLGSRAASLAEPNLAM